jgi:hypothetical protein
MNASRLPFEVGQSSAVDELAGGCPQVFNILVDAGGANVRRPGRRAFLAAQAPATGGVIGATVFDRNLVYATADRRLWRVHPGAPDTVIPLTDPGDPLTFIEGGERVTFIEGTPDRLVIAGGGAIQTWLPSDLFCKRLVPSPNPVTNDPPFATHIGWLGNRLVSNDLRAVNRYLWSDLLDETIWPPLNVNTADAQPDAIQAVFSNSRELFVFGASTVQAYSLGSDPLLPFLASSTVQIGAITRHGIIPVNDVFAWLDDQKRFVISNARSFEVISDPISSDLRALSKVTDAYGYRIEFGRFSFLLWVFPAAGRSFYFDMNRKQWGEWPGFAEGEFVGLDLGAYVYWPDLDKHVIGLASAPHLFELSASSAEDFSGGIIAVHRTLPAVDNGTLAAKACDRDRYVLRRGVKPFGQSDVFEVAHRDDIGAWSGWTQIPLGDTSDRETVVEDFPGGVYRRRQRRVRYTGNADEFTLVLGESRWEQLESGT